MKQVYIEHSVYSMNHGNVPEGGASAVNAEAALIVLAASHPGSIDCRASNHQTSKAQIVTPTYWGFRGNPVLLDRSVFLK